MQRRVIDPRQTPTPDPARSRAFAAARQGDGTAFQRLVRPHVRAMHALAARMLGGEAGEAEDVVQESLVRAWRGIDALQQPSSLRAWLLRVVARLAIDALRGARSRPQSVSLDEVDVPAALGPGATDAVWERELADRLEEALERLPVRQRTALHLRAREGFDYAAIAAVLECSSGAARMLVLGARRRVRERLGEHLEP
jgi:RNA polymerase sigma-70 factor (ECF subfamily)